MHKASHILVLVFVSICSLTDCSHQNPSEIRTKQPDAILFERATTAIQQKRFTVANLDLQALVNTYPDSKYVERAQRMLQDPQIAKCGGGFSNRPNLCDPEITAARRGQ